MDIFLKNNKIFFLVAIGLFLPFCAVYIYTSGLATGLDTVFSVDEGWYHYPTILKFADELPTPYLKDYNSATTPLFHLIVAALSKILGTDIKNLRLVNFFITYFSVLFLFIILIGKFKLNLLHSLLFSLLFAFSPYYFREAFVILTDNLPILWLLCFFYFYFSYKTGKKPKQLLLSLFFVMLLCLTRQTYLFVCLAVGIDTLPGKMPVLGKIKILLLVFIAALPTVFLFLIWKGLTPPAFQEYHTRNSLLNTKAVLYGMSVLGFYSLFIPGINLFRSLFEQKKQSILIGIAVLIWIIIYFFPLIKQKGDFGYLWYVADPLPSLGGTSILFWVLVPLGAISLLCIWNKEGVSFFLLFLLCLFLSETPNNLIFQRYYDSSVLLTLIFFSARYHVSNKVDLYRRIALIAFFIAYFVVFTIA